VISRKNQDLGFLEKCRENPTRLKKFSKIPCENPTKTLEKIMPLEN
jgi:hypothetical protein